MQARPVVLVALVAVSVLLGLWLWLSTPGGPDPEERPPTSSADAGSNRSPAPTGETGAREAAQTEWTGSVSHGDDATVDRSDHDAVEDPTGDLELYRRTPMSEIPHQVVRGWGARGGASVPGVVGAFVVVDAGIDDDDLVRLAGDIRDFHHDATALSVRILDSQAAATYERHRDGGVFAAEHLVGLVSRNTKLGIDRIEIRGRAIDSSDQRLR